MKMVRIVIFTVISCLLISCVSKPPQYTAKFNTYNFDFYNNQNGNLINESLVHTFTTESLEHMYYETFCAGISDCGINIDNVKRSAVFGNYDLSKNPITHNSLNISKVNVYRLTYTTTGQNHELRHVSGAVFIPNIPANKIKGAILYFHPTFFARTSTPSFGMTTNTQDNSIASVFATQGYIIIAPDYIGMGIDDTVPHPYILYPLVNANDGLSILTASRKFLDKLGYTKSLPLLITGFSEGSSYALWFSRLYQEQTRFKQLTDSNKFNLKLVAPVAGAYDLSGVVYNYLFDNISLLNKSTYNAYSSIVAARLKPGLVAFALVGYAFYGQHSDYNKVFRSDFFNMQCSWQKQEHCNFDNKNLNLVQAFDQKNDLDIVNKIDNSAAYKYYAGNIFTSQTNNIYPLINPNLLLNEDFINAFNKADIYYWHSEIPTTLIYLKLDSVVSPYNTEYAYRGMLENNSRNLKKIEIDNSLIKSSAASYLPYFDVDHVIALPYVTLTVLQQFKETINK